MKDEKDDLVAGSHSILVMWRNHLFQLLNVRGFNVVTRTQKYTAELLVPDSNAFEVELAVEKLKSHSVKIDNISLERVVECRNFYLLVTIQKFKV